MKNQFLEKKRHLELQSYPNILISLNLAKWDNWLIGGDVREFSVSFFQDRLTHRLNHHQENRPKSGSLFLNFFSSARFFFRLKCLKSKQKIIYQTLFGLLYNRRIVAKKKKSDQLHQKYSQNQILTNFNFSGEKIFKKRKFSKQKYHNRSSR